MSHYDISRAENVNIPFIDSSDAYSTQKSINHEGSEGQSSLSEKTVNRIDVEAAERGTVAINNRNAAIPDDNSGTNARNKSGIDTTTADAVVMQNVEKFLEQKNVIGESSVTACDDFDHSSIDQRTRAESDMLRELSYEQVQTQAESLKMLHCDRLLGKEATSPSYSTEIPEKQSGKPAASQTKKHLLAAIAIPSGDASASITDNSQDRFSKNSEQAVDENRMHTIPIKIISATEEASFQDARNSKKIVNDKGAKNEALVPPPKPPIRHLSDDVAMDSVAFRATTPAPTPPPRRNSIMASALPPTPSLSIRSSYRRSSMASSRTNTMKYNISRGMLTFPTLPRNARPPTRGIHYLRNFSHDKIGRASKEIRFFF
ncbi:hypothetical protein KIN20_023001 [Parelaphostrongylus tenuis]|uniref:Uncharacterized protein n=1 Tax=Parelaphostrongylus tenuis TaxID=148309 RepID=A0AAD5QX43_PARTN|nr:hypothetical protein KIN20_023001 [Parelaphostrongylus tenuis]